MATLSALPGQNQPVRWIVPRRRGAARRRTWRASYRRRGDHWKNQPRDPAGKNAGRWVKSPVAAAVAAVKDAAKAAGVPDPKAFGTFTPSSDASWGRSEKQRLAHFPNDRVARDADNINVGEVIPILGDRVDWAKVVDRSGKWVHFQEPGKANRRTYLAAAQKKVRQNAAERAWREAGGSSAAWNDVRDTAAKTAAAAATAAKAAPPVAKPGDRRAELTALKVVELKELLGKAGLPKSGRKADLVDRLVGHTNGPRRPQPADKVKAASKGAGADEPVRPDGPRPLGEVPASRVPGDDRPGDVLHRPGGGDRDPDRRPGRRPGTTDSGGPAVPGTAGADDRGEADSGAGGAGGDAAAGGGGRDRGVDAPVFRPRSQDDLAPATEKKRLAANIDALRTLRTLQAQGRPATAEEQAKLARWSAWGSLPGVFKEPPPDRTYAAAQADLKQLLSPADFAAARRTTRNAHYTDVGYVRAIWDAMRGLGFGGGEVLEPGSGSGTFMGVVPPDIAADTHVTGVELDPVTAAISRALYPNQDVRTESFTDTKTADGAFDATIGNVPFSDTKLFDPEYNPGRRHNMHNHFILKSLRMTRPGGLVSVITSRYTMDSASPAAREEMAKLGDLVGAVRLPSGAHERAAGTAVVTDLLIFRRRKPATPYAGLPFASTRTVRVDDKDIAINEAFVDDQGKPTDMVLGTLGAVHGMRGKDDLTVKGDKNAEPALREALDRVVAQANAAGLTQSAERRPRPTFAATGVARKPDGYLQTQPDGSFTRLVGGREQPHKVPAKQSKELRQLLHLRDTIMALVNAEASSGDDTDEMKRLREDLNDTYDGYVAEYGPVSRFTERRTSKAGSGEDVEEERVTRVRPPQGGFRADPFSAAVRSLEAYDPVTGTARKADIFHRRGIAPRAPQTAAQNPADALAITMDEVGQVDLPHVADLLGLEDEDEARSALGTLVYDEPGTARVVPAAEYLSGNVRAKLDAARLAAAEDPAYDANVEALQRVLPADLTSAEIHAKMGAGWIDPKHVQQFLREILRDRTLTVQRAHGTDWKVESSRKRTPATTTEWGIRERNAVELAEDILSQRPIRVMVDEKLSQDKTEAAQAKAREIADRFTEWAWEDPARAKDLQDTYNRLFNSLVLRSYDGGDMSLPGLSREGFYGYPHRYAAVRRIVAEPSVGLWHEVGAGKTSVMIIGAMEMRRLGLVQKPAIVVPNHMLEQMTREFLERYPQARVLGIGSDDLKNDKDGEKRREIIARAATGDWDAVILTQGAFKRLPVSTQTEKTYLQSEVEPLRRSVARRRAEVEQSIRAENPTAGEEEITDLVRKALAKDTTVKELEGLVEKAEERVKEHLAGAARDPGLTFEQTGIDYLFVDEAHTYKNLRTPSRIQGMGIPGSAIATDLHMKLHHLRSRYDRVATLATATPIANSVSEAYTMLRYLRPDLLEDMGIDTFDDFAANFGEVIARLEVAPTGGLRTHSRFARFVNIPELLRPWLIAADVKTADDLKDIVKTPNLVERVDINGNRTRTPETVVVPPSEELKNLMGELVLRAKNVPFPPRKGDDNMLKITGEGRAAALDLQMVGRRTDEPTKLDVAADRIASIHEENKDRVYTDRDGNPTGKPGALQLVFSDIGTPGGGRRKPKGGATDAAEESIEDAGNTGLADFSAYEALRDKLVERGIPRSKIRFIHEANTDQEKAELFAAARDGRVAVLVGSTNKMGVGTNVQDRAVALHHLDAPWRPADVQQREGRIVRQGNKNPEVQVIRYVTEQSFDAYIWQAITTKGTFINQIMRGRHDVREMDDIGEFALSAAEVTALGTGNRWLIEHADAQADLTRLERALHNHEAEQRNIGRQIPDSEAGIRTSEQLIAEADQAILKRVDTRGKNFQMSLGDLSFTNRTDAQDRLRQILKRVARGEERDSTIGELGGLPLRAENTGNGVRVELLGAPGAAVTLGRSEIDSGDVIGKLQTGLDNLEKVRARHVARVQETRQDIESLRSRLGTPFRDTEALKTARDRLERVEAELRAELERRGESLEPQNPEEKAAAARTAAVADLRERLAAGQGFAGIGEVTTWLEADPELVGRIPQDAGAKWGAMSTGGQLVVHKEPDGNGWRITIPRTMRTPPPMADFRTRADAAEFAEALEGSGIPWNAGIDLTEWRAADGAGAGEVIARLRGESRKLDKNGTWKDAATKAEIRRRIPERLREPLLEGRHRSDGLGVSAFARLTQEDRERIFPMLQGDPDSDPVTAVQLREFGLAKATSYEAQRVALAAAERLERDFRQRNPQPLDAVRQQFQKDFEKIRYQERPKAQLDQILAGADVSGDFAAAAAKLRALADELTTQSQHSWGSYGNQAVADVARSLAEVLAARAELVARFADWSDAELRALLAQHGLSTDGDRWALLRRLRAAGVSVPIPENTAGLEAVAARSPTAAGPGFPRTRTAAAMAVFVIDTLTGRRYTPQQRQARRGWIREKVRAAGTDTHPGGEELEHWWTATPEGLAKWAVGHEHPWTTLYHSLLAKMDGNTALAKKTAGAWYFKVFGHGPTADEHRDWKTQPRDPSGKNGGQWVKAGVGGGGAAPATPRKMGDAEFEARQARLDEAISATYRTLATDVTHTDEDGVWLPERDAIHREIAADMYAEARTVPTDGRAVIAGGLGGAGKSTVLRDHAGIDPGEFLTINPDDVKEELARRGLVPEIPDHPDLSPMERAALIHVESGRIAELVADMAYRDRRNIIWDITMSSAPWVEGMIDEIRRRHGYTDVRGVFVDIPVEVSVTRALDRYRRGADDYASGKGLGGRYVPPRIIRAQAVEGGGTLNQRAFEELKRMFDRWSFYDNSRYGQAPRLVEEGGPHGDRS